MMPNPNESVFYRRRLPHLYVNSHPVFITWRLKFDLPNFIKQHLNEMKEEFDKETKDLSDEYRSMQGYTFHKKVFGWLDAQLGTADNLPVLLKEENIVKTISDALHFNDDKKYLLHAYCIMPNHVHVLITPFANQTDMSKSLSEITHGWKRITSIRINEILNKQGTLWASESYDHVVRNETEFSRIIAYILNNPVKANLVKNWQDWKGSWVAKEFVDIMG